MSWGVGGFLVSNFLQRVGPAETRKLQERVAAELKTTFASHYTTAGGASARRAGRLQQAGNWGEISDKSEQGLGRMIYSPLWPMAGAANDHRCGCDAGLWPPGPASQDVTALALAWRF